MAQRTLRRAVSDEDKQQRRREILEAAKGVFADRGFHETTIADVARGADLSYGVVYWYFDSKEALFHALMEAEEDRLRRSISAALRATTDDRVDGILVTAVTATFEFFEQDPDATRLLFREPSALGEGFERHLFGIFERFIGDLEALIVAASDAGTIREAPPRIVAVTSAGLIGQIALRRITTDDGLSAAEAADFIVGVLLDGLRPRPEQSPVSTHRDGE